MLQSMYLQFNVVNVVNFVYSADHRQGRFSGSLGAGWLCEEFLKRLLILLRFCTWARALFRPYGVEVQRRMRACVRSAWLGDSWSGRANFPTYTTINQSDLAQPKLESQVKFTLVDVVVVP